eukprot:8462191-Pyramimonas_sp.AAC.1
MEALWPRAPALLRRKDWCANKLSAGGTVNSMGCGTRGVFRRRRTCAWQPRYSPITNTGTLSSTHSPGGGSISKLSLTPSALMDAMNMASARLICLVRACATTERRCLSKAFSLAVSLQLFNPEELKYTEPETRYTARIAHDIASRFLPVKFPFSLWNSCALCNALRTRPTDPTK